MSAKHDLAIRRKSRLRYQIKHKSHGRPRLSVFRSGKNIYAQIIDDTRGRTVAAASTLDAAAEGRIEDRAPIKPQRRRLENSSLSARWPPGSSRLSSTAVPTSTMAGSRPWPMPPAKAGWTSKGTSRACGSLKD